MNVPIPPGAGAGTSFPFLVPIPPPEPPPVTVIHGDFNGDGVPDVMTLDPAVGGAALVQLGVPPVPPVPRVTNFKIAGGTPPERTMLSVSACTSPTLPACASLPQS